MDNGDDDLGLSEKLQIGKAAEHLVCADLLLQGYNAFLSDAGLPYDVIVDIGTRMYRVQVKGVQHAYVNESKDPPTVSYRFSFRKGRDGGLRVNHNHIDVAAFVALDVRRIGYVHVTDLLGAEEVLPYSVEFAALSGGRRGWGTRTFDSCSEFPLTGSDATRKTCFRCKTKHPATAEFFTKDKKCRGGITGICLVCKRLRDNEVKAALRDRRLQKKMAR